LNGIENTKNQKINTHLLSEGSADDAKQKNNRDCFHFGGLVLKTQHGARKAIDRSEETKKQRQKISADSDGAIPESSYFEFHDFS
jgi:hypothetical protein